MINVKLLGVFLSVGVAAGIIGGLTHLLITGSDHDKSGNSVDQPEKEDLVETESSFFAVAIDESKKDSKILKKSCSINADCAVYKISGPFSFSEDKSQKTTLTPVNLSADIKPNLQYVLKLTTKKLNNKDQVEIVFSEANKHLFEIKSSATITEDNSVKPTLPEGILPKSELKIPKKDEDSFVNWSPEQKASRKYYTDLYPTFIERDPLKHDDFLVMSWDPAERYQPGKVFWPLENGEMLDKFLFKPIEDQLRDKDDNSQVTIDVNSKEQTNKAVMEIYQIKNQEALKNAFAAKTSDRSARFTPSGISWDEIASENIMVTKLTALEYGKYYKFVFKDYKSFGFSMEEGISILSVILKKVYIDPLAKPPLVHKLFEIESVKTGSIPSLCSYVKDKPKLTYCKWLFG